MAIIVVGGSGRGAGKTALVCGLIRALPEIRWTPEIQATLAASRLRFGKRPRQGRKPTRRAIWPLGRTARCWSRRAMRRSVPLCSGFSPTVRRRPAPSSSRTECFAACGPISALPPLQAPGESISRRSISWSSAWTQWLSWPATITSSSERGSPFVWCRWSACHRPCWSGCGNGSAGRLCNMPYHTCVIRQGPP